MAEVVVFIQVRAYPRRDDSLPGIFLLEIKMSKEKNLNKNADKCDLKQKKENAEPLKIFIAVVPFLIGVYYEWTSCLASMFLLGYLWYCFRMNGKIQIFWSLPILAAVVIPVAYGISTFWAVDSGMALFGMVKFLSLPLFVLAVQQTGKEERESLTDYVPSSGMIMVILSWILGMVPVLEVHFGVNGRLAGFFQYPNTFALYLLVGIIILVSKGQWDKAKVFNIFILFTGILLTGSRTGFALLVATVLCFCFLIREKRVRLGLLGILFLLVAATGIYVVVSGNTGAVGRYLTASFSSSTFLGRLLYYKDAIPVIFRHPFGLGYMGYYFTQGAFQTGVYSVVNIHNELLQFLMDIGWIPAGILIWAVIKGIISGGVKERLIIVMILLHSLVDFNLQFLSIFFVLFSVIVINEKNTGEKLRKSVLVTGVVLISCVSLYFGLDSALYYLKQYSASAHLYPGNTNAWMQLLVTAEDTEEMDEIAEKILVMNPDNPLANNAKARVSYASGDFGKMISYKQAALKYYRYDLEEYLDYFNMLYVGYQLYIENDDPDSASICRDQLLKIPNMIEEVLNETDPLAYRIHDKPELEMPKEYKDILRLLE